MEPLEKDTAKRPILLVDDHILLLETLKFAIEAGDYEASTCNSFAEAIGALDNGSKRFDLILLDVNMPDMTGMKSIVEIVEKAAPVPVVLLSGGVSDQFIRQAIHHGIRGYIPKNTNLRSLHDNLRVVLNGGTCALASVLSSKPVVDNPWGLSPREQMIGALLAQGLNNKVVASELRLSEPTVKMHLRSIFRKLGAANRTQVAAAFQKHNLLALGVSETLEGISA